MLRPMECGDIPAVVSVHLRAFPNFFLSFLGPRFLQLLYQGIVMYPEGIAFVYLGNKGIQGFVVGTTAPASFYRYLLRHQMFAFARATLRAVARRPSIVPRLLRAFLYPGQSSSQANKATLMSIAVDPAAQGQGIGQQLVGAFLDEARLRRVAQVSLTTDKLNNDSVNLFYQRMGFYRVRDYATPEGREMNEYLMTI